MNNPFTEEKVKEVMAALKVLKEIVPDATLLIGNSGYTDRVMQFQIRLEKQEIDDSELLVSGTDGRM